MPKIKDCLVAEGMPLTDFSKLIKQLGANLQNEELVHIKKSEQDLNFFLQEKVELIQSSIDAQ